MGEGSHYLFLWFLDSFPAGRPFVCGSPSTMVAWLWWRRWMEGGRGPRVSVVMLDWGFFPAQALTTPRLGRTLLLLNALRDAKDNKTTCRACVVVGWMGGWVGVGRRQRGSSMAAHDE